MGDVCDKCREVSNPDQKDFNGVNISALPQKEPGLGD